MRKILKWIGIILAGLVGLLVVAAVGVVYAISEFRFNRTYAIEVEPAPGSRTRRDGGIWSLLVRTVQPMSRAGLFRGYVPGVTLGGRQLNDQYMPYETLFGDMTDEEWEAIWLYMQTLPPTEYGNR